MIAIARAERPFDASEREMLRYLADKLSVSLEKIEMHELVFERDGGREMKTRRSYFAGAGVVLSFAAAAWSRSLRSAR